MNGRLLSLDFLRGLTMVLLALEAAGLYDWMLDHSGNGIFHAFAEQFHHHPWNGLRFWDLIQPMFMFIAGTAMAFSLDRQVGVSWRHQFQKALKRSAWLFFWGVLIYAVKKDGLSFELWNVLTQLSFTLLLAFLIFRWSFQYQVLVCLFLLLLTEFLYRYTQVPGFDQPFVDQHNFGNYIDQLLMGKINGGGWVAINAVPTAVHTIAGALVGKWFIQVSPQSVKPLVGIGVICLVLGFGLDLLNITPIIKRIATTSFTLASLGYCLLMLAVCYWAIDIQNRRKCLFFFTVVGMNSLFIYLFFEIPGGRWFNAYIRTICEGLLNYLHFPASLIGLISCLVIFGLMWGMCYFLYHKKIFFRV